MTPISSSHHLRRWLSGLVESSFNVEIGLCDPTLVEYVVGLLTDFIHVQRINLVQDGSGRSVEAVAEMLSATRFQHPAASVQRRLTVHRHIGDFTLFWTGVYPEQLRRMRRRHERDALLSYQEQGKRAYAIASELSSDETEPPAAVLRRLSDQFEHCVYGLGLVRKSWEQADPAGFGAVNRAWLQ